jgi:hypothetical protein
MVAVLAACGPSVAEVRTARTTVYDASARELFDVAKGVASAHFGIAATDDEHLALLTRPVSYDPDGRLGARGWGRRPVRIAFEVHVHPLMGHRAVVTVSTRAKRAFSLCSQPCASSWFDLDPSDGAIDARSQAWGDRLAYEIYENARSHRLVAN